MLNMEVKTRLEELQFAIDLARNVLARNNVVILDTETTGFKSPQAIQIAIIDHTGQILFYQDIKPFNKPIEDAALAIHGISNDRLIHASSFAEYHDQLTRVLDHSSVIGYRTNYDIEVLENSATVYGLDLPAMMPFCVMDCFATVYGETSRHGKYKWKSLKFAMDFFGLAAKGELHDALNDAYATLEIVRAIAASCAHQLIAMQNKHHFENLN